MSAAELEAIDRRIEALLKLQEEDRKRAEEEWKKRQDEWERQKVEAAKEQKKTEKMLEELGKQIGGLGNKFGSFTEGLGFNSIARILREQFGMEIITPMFNIRKHGREEEYDMLALSNGGRNEGFIVEIKSHLRLEDVQQMKRKTEELFEWMPGQRQTTFHAMIAYVTGDADIKRQIIENGWYLAHVGEELFEMEVPEGFQGKAYRYEG